MHDVSHNNTGFIREILEDREKGAARLVAERHGARRDARRNGTPRRGGGRRYRLTDAATGRAIQNGDSGFWTARDLSLGIPVEVVPQARLLLRLEAER